MYVLKSGEKKKTINLSESITEMIANINVNLKKRNIILVGEILA